MLATHVQHRLGTMGIDRGWVPNDRPPNGSAWLRLLEEMERLAAPPAFVRNCTNTICSGNDQIVSSQPGEAAWGCAVCGGCMRAGRHAIRITCLEPDSLDRESGFLYVGVVSSGFEPKAGLLACDTSSGHMFDVMTGLYRCDGQDRSWTGMQAGDAGCTVGLLLDMSVGSLEVFLDNEEGHLTHLGYLVRSGLRGPLAFAVDVYECAAQVQATTANALCAQACNIVNGFT